MPNSDRRNNPLPFKARIFRAISFFSIFVVVAAACSLLPASQPEAVAPAPSIPPTSTAVTQESSPTSQPLPTKEQPALSAERVASLPDPAGYDWRLFADGFDRPIYMTDADDGSGRLFVVEKPGRIWILQEGERLLTPFMDIRNLVSSQESERGLLSLAFHPEYSENGFFFIYYTNMNGDTVLARYQVSDDPNLANPDSAEILLKISQPYANHNGGHLAFGPDGYLYLSTGDGGSAGDPAGNGQNLLSFLGKVLRLDVDGQLPYESPEDNFTFVMSSALSEIWLYGLRNPWRYSFDRATGDMIIGDVGQNVWEEIDLIPAGTPGGNLGWDLFEGNHLFEGSESQREGLIFPILEYQHSGGNCSVTGGYVYRGEALPEWYGVYLFGDYCTGIVWGALPGADGLWQAAQLFDLPISLVSFAEDQSGELYVIDLNGGIYRLTSQ